MHIVHYSTEYASLGDAAQQPGGLAVLAVMYEVWCDYFSPFIVEHEMNTSKFCPKFLQR